MLEGFKDVSKMVMEHTGVYILYFNEEMLYIGKSINLYERVGSHLRRMRKGKMFRFNRICIHLCSPGEALGLEFTLINKYRPPYNVNNLGSSLTEKPIDLKALGIDITSLKRKEEQMNQDSTSQGFKRRF